jgi:hypothetical protein
MELYHFCELCGKVIPVIYRTLILGGFIFVLPKMFVWRLKEDLSDKRDEDKKEDED